MCVLGGGSQMFQPLPADEPTLSLSYPPHHVPTSSLSPWPISRPAAGSSCWFQARPTLTPSCGLWIFPRVPEGLICSVGRNIIPPLSPQPICEASVQDLLSTFLKHNRFSPNTEPRDYTVACHQCYCKQKHHQLDYNLSAAH